MDAILGDKLPYTVVIPNELEASLRRVLSLGLGRRATDFGITDHSVFCSVFCGGPTKKVRDDLLGFRQALCRLIDEGGGPVLNSEIRLDAENG